jgi:hypothetical protein
MMHLPKQCLQFLDCPQKITILQRW